MKRTLVFLAALTLAAPALAYVQPAPPTAKQIANSYCGWQAVLDGKTFLGSCPEHGGEAAQCNPNTDPKGCKGCP